MLKNRRGFTLIELIIVITCIGILATISLPMIYDIAGSAEQDAEDEMVGNIRTGLQLQFAQTMVDNGGLGTYPDTLDSAQAGSSSVSNPFFTNVLQDSYKGNDWVTDGNGTYVGPAGNSYNYQQSTGTFNKLDE